MCSHLGIRTNETNFKADEYTSTRFRTSSFLIRWQISSASAIAISIAISACKSTRKKYLNNRHVVLRRKIYCSLSVSPVLTNFVTLYALKGILLNCLLWYRRLQISSGVNNHRKAHGDHVRIVFSKHSVKSGSGEFQVKSLSCYDSKNELWLEYFWIFESILRKFSREALLTIRWIKTWVAVSYFTWSEFGPLWGLDFWGPANRMKICLVLPNFVLRIMILVSAKVWTFLRRYLSSLACSTTQTP